MIDYPRLAKLHEHWIDVPGYPLEPDFPREEYALRIARARTRMHPVGLDALVVTSGAVGQWFEALTHDLTQQPMERSPCPAFPIQHFSVI